MYPINKIIDVLDVFKILRKNPELLDLNKTVKQRDLDNKIKIRISKFYEENKDKILNIKKKIYNS